MRSAVEFVLNGKPMQVGADQARMMVGDFLRLQMGLPGTKIVCAEGDCGACTVLVAQPTKKAEFIPVNSCIYSVAQLDGCAVVTIDALAMGESLTPVQKAMVQCHGSQCGYCTPGFVMALTGLVEKRCAQGATRLEVQETKNALTGNLCRCTGYQPILDAACAISVAEHQPIAQRFLSAKDLRVLREIRKKPLALSDGGYELFAPRSLKDAARWLKKNPGARLLAGGTDLGVFHNKRKHRLTQVLSLHCVAGLGDIKKLPCRRIRVGAGVTLSELRRAIEKSAPEFARFLDLFASPQIKNVATLAGNVANASPIGDTPPFLLVAGAVVEIQGTGAKRRVPIEKFFRGYRKTALARGELIAAIEFDLEAEGELVRLYKVSQRKDLDISTVSAAIRIWKDPKKAGHIVCARVAFGGVAATPVRLPKLERLLTGAEFGPKLLIRARDALHGDLNPIGDLRGSAAFRRVVAGKLLDKFFAEATR